MIEPLWVEAAVVYQVHAMQIAVFGGVSGIRDKALIESALARPKQLFTYGEADVFELAAAYTAGLLQNHGFVDGNKRTAFVVGEIFLRANGYRTVATQSEVVEAVVSLASHAITESTYVEWLRDHRVALASAASE